VTVHLSLLALQNVQPNAAPASAPPPGAPGIAVAPAGGAAPPPAPGGSPYMSLIMVLMFAPILFFMFRRNNKEREARGKLKKGDRIASTSGLVGELIEMDERFAKVKLGPGNTVTMLTSSLLPLEPAPAAKTDDKDLKDLKEAKATGDKK
jgi:preprotein translocase YajC subunit